MFRKPTRKTYEVTPDKPLPDKVVREVVKKITDELGPIVHERGLHDACVAFTIAKVAVTTGDFGLAAATLAGACKVILDHEERSGVDPMQQVQAILDNARRAADE